MKKVLTLIALLTFTILLPISTISAQESAGIIKSLPVQGAITLDGRIDQEWDSVDKTLFTLYNFQQSFDDKEMVIASVYNATTLFLWISVNDTHYGPELHLIFQTNLSSPLLVNPGTIEFADGNDMKTIDGDNTTRDFVSLSNVFWGDTMYGGGTYDIEGNCIHRWNGYDFEIAIPLNSSDTVGADFALVPGGSINLFPQYNWLYTLIQNEDTWEQLNVELVIPSNPSIPSYSISILLFSMIAVSLILVFKHHSKE